jgi:hypothetical protein
MFDWSNIYALSLPSVRALADTVPSVVVSTTAGVDAGVNVTATLDDHVEAARTLAVD